MVTQTHRGEYTVLYANPPACEDAVAIGVVLHDPESRRLHVRLRQDWDTFIKDEETWYFEKLPQALQDLERDLGSQAAFDLITQGSNAVTSDEPQTLLVANFPAALVRLYAKWVPAAVRRFETHLPLYSLRSAAGRFLENSEIEPEGWIEIPGARTLSQGQFIARIEGTSMEPLAPHGSLAIFDSEHKGGSRSGRYVLVEERRRGEANGYTLKKYESVKQAYSEDSSVRTAIRLLPLNPEHDVIELVPEEDRYQIIGFFVDKLDPELAEGLVEI